MSRMELDLLMDPLELMNYLEMPLKLAIRASPEWRARSAGEFSECVEKFSFLRGHGVMPNQMLLLGFYENVLGRNLLECVLHRNYTKTVESIFMLFSLPQGDKFVPLRSLILETYMETTRSLDQLVVLRNTYPNSEISLTKVTFLSLRTLLELMPLNNEKLASPAA